MNIGGRGWIKVSNLRKILTELPGDLYVTCTGDNKPLHVGSDPGVPSSKALGVIDLTNETTSVKTEEIA